MVAVNARRTAHAAVVTLAVLAVVITPPAAASTPSPGSVTIAGDLQSEVGCAGDWDPGCAATHLAYDAIDDVWQRTFSVPSGVYSYKAALNDAWDENYGLNASPGGMSIPLSTDAGSVKFYYDHKTHWVTDNESSLIVVAPGDFQSELGCPGDWQPDCLRSWLQDPDGDGIYAFETATLPAGSYETKAAVDEDWAVSYGAGGAVGGANIPFVVPVDGATVAFTFDATSHVLTVTVASSDITSPSITAHRDPLANGYGWNRTDVTVDFSCTDDPGGTGVATVSAPVTLASEGADQEASGSCVDVAGNSASTVVSGISIDRTPPSVVYAGNVGSYTVDQRVVMTCAAEDSLSGLVTSTCANITRPAYSFGLGSRTVSATAVDKAGNSARTTASFVVSATAPSMCSLTKRLVRNSTKYRTDDQAQRTTADALTTRACALLRVASSTQSPSQKRSLITAYKSVTGALASAGWLTHPQATMLRTFAGTL